MKHCPKCNAFYQDPSLNFCLEDGTPLQAGNPGQPSQTAPTMAPGGQVTFGAPQTGSGSVPNAPGSFGGQQAAQMQPTQKSRNTLLWVAIVILVAIVTCGGGFLVLGLIGISMDKADNAKNDKPATAQEPKSEMKFDFSKWRSETDEYAVLEIDGDAALLKTKSRQYYYVLLVGSPFVSYNRGASVTVTNMDGIQSSQGYGLVFHSGVPALDSDYAFLIDADRGEFKVVRHTNKTERQISDWKASDAIKGGSAENVLEIVDDGAKIDCRINGESVFKFYDDDSTKKDGTIGIYASDAKIRFTDLKTFK